MSRSGRSPARYGELAHKFMQERLAMLPIVSMSGLKAAWLALRGPAGWISVRAGLRSLPRRIVGLQFLAKSVASVEGSNDYMGRGQPKELP